MLTKIKIKLMIVSPNNPSILCSRSRKWLSKYSFCNTKQPLPQHQPLFLYFPATKPKTWMLYQISWIGGPPPPPPFIGRWGFSINVLLPRGDSSTLAPISHHAPGSEFHAQSPFQSHPPGCLFYRPIFFFIFIEYIISAWLLWILIKWKIQSN